MMVLGVLGALASSFCHAGNECRHIQVGKGLPRRLYSQRSERHPRAAAVPSKQVVLPRSMPTTGAKRRDAKPPVLSID